LRVTVLIRRFIPYLARVRGPIALSFACMVAGPLAGAGLLWLVERQIDTVFVGGHLSLLPYFLAGYFALAAVKFAVERLQDRASVLGSRRIVAGLKADLYRHILNLSPGSVPDLSVGQSLSRLSGDTKQAEYLVYSGILGAVSNIVRVLAYTAFLWSLSAPLTLCAVVAMPLLAVASLKGAARLRTAYDEIGKAAGGVTSLAEERLSALPIIQAFATMDREAELFQARCDASVDVEAQAWTLQTRLSALFEGINTAVAVGLMAIGAYEIHTGAISVGGVVAYMGSLAYLFEPAKSLATTWSRLQRAASSAERLCALLDTKSKVAEPAAPVSLPTPRGALEFRDVHFSYKSKPTLQGVSLKIEPGEHVAIVGASGAGKSTLLRLALRLHDPAEGSVLLDGVDLRELAIADVRNAMSVVLQDALIFRGSIGENLRYGNPDAPEARLLSMSRIAQAHDFISALPKGYADKTGSRGGYFSGGQRQRLSIARALVRESSILLFDEMTSALDGKTEAAIQEALKPFKGRRTVVTITHRLASVRAADRVIVMEQGRIVESGTPDALLAGETKCRELFASQMEQTLRLSA